MRKRERGSESDRLILQIFASYPGPGFGSVSWYLFAAAAGRRGRRGGAVGCHLPFQRGS